MTTDRQMREALAARFPADLERRFEGRGGRTFTYVPDESVMDRLDDVFGVGGWSIGVDPMGDRCVRVTLRALGVDYQDFGYSNNADSAEPLKEASGDGLRRCARYIGIARYLYAGDVRPQPVQTVTTSPTGTTAVRTARIGPPDPTIRGLTPDERAKGMAEDTYFGPARVAPAPLPTRLSEEDAPWPEEIPTIRGGAYDGAPSAAKPGEVCPEHNLPWKGEPFDLYHKMVEGGYHRHPANTPRARVRA